MKRLISIILIQAFFITNIGISASDINRSSLRRQVGSNQRIIYTLTLKQDEFVNFQGELLINDKLSDSQKEEVKAHGLNHILSFYLIKHKRDVWDEIEKKFTRHGQWEYLLRELVRLRVQLSYKRNNIDIDTFSIQELEKILKKNREFGSKYKKRPSNKTNRVTTNWVVEILGLWAEFSSSFQIETLKKSAEDFRSFDLENDKEFVQVVNKIVAANEELFKDVGYITDDKSFTVYIQSHLEEVTRGLDASGVGEMARCWLMELKKIIREKARNGDEIDRDAIKEHLSGHYATFDLNDEAFNEIIDAESEKISELQNRLTELLVENLEQRNLGNLDYDDDEIGRNISHAILDDLILKEIIPKVNRKRLGEISEDELIKDIAGKLKDELFYDIDEVTEYILEGVIRENPEILKSIGALRSSIEKLAVLHKKDSDGPDDDDTGAAAGKSEKGKSGSAGFKNTFGTGEGSKEKTGFFRILFKEWGLNPPLSQ